LNDRARWILLLSAVVALGLTLRLHGIHDPILDHPGWRQGDTAAIARNFARLQYDVMYPQTSYNGAPPNYVELELQIVPFLAASLYKAFGIHEIFGRLISLGFSLATVIVIAYFARWLFGSAAAGIAAAFFYAVFPGSVYYGRTFMPDCAMTFFLTAALFAAARYLLDGRRLAPRGLAGATSLLAAAYLAKPVAVVALAPVLGMLWERARAKLAVQPAAIAVLIGLPLLVLVAYDRRVASYAEWHWASGITRLHVLPALRAAFGGVEPFMAKLGQFRFALGMLRDTMLGRFAFWLAVASFAALPWIEARSKALLWTWLAGSLVYAFVVVTVERVDYYLLPLLPLCALVIGALAARFLSFVRAADPAPAARYALLAMAPMVGLAVLLTSRAPVAAYYQYNKQVYRSAAYLNHTLPKDALVVIGHYGPEVQYYIDRFGWEEDPELWTAFDEESAIRKGARYFIAIEDRRLRANLELCAWLARFPVSSSSGWPVYETDPAKTLPGSRELWRAFRSAEREGDGRAFLDARGICRL